MAEFAGRVAEAALKILTHYGDIEKNFKFLKEVKILSKFFRINWHAQLPIYARGGNSPAKDAHLADCAMPRLIDASADSESNTHPSLLAHRRIKLFSARPEMLPAVSRPCRIVLNASCLPSVFPRAFSFL